MLGDFMMELCSIGINDISIKNMVDSVPEIKDLSEKDIVDKINFLKKLGCSENQIVNIICSNPRFLCRTSTGLINLIYGLSDFGFSEFNILLDSNPYILNLEFFEVNNYINTMLNNGALLEDIVDNLDSNPYLFNEM